MTRTILQPFIACSPQRTRSVCRAAGFVQVAFMELGPSEKAFDATCKIRCELQAGASSRNGRKCGFYRHAGSFLASKHHAVNDFEVAYTYTRLYAGYRFSRRRRAALPGCAVSNKQVREPARPSTRTFALFSLTRYTIRAPW